MVTSSLASGFVGNRQAGIALLWAAGLLLVCAVGWWGWENSDSRENERETKALTSAMSGHGSYEEPEPNMAPAIVLGVGAAVAFLGGVVLLNPPRATPGASDHPSPETETP